MIFKALICLILTISTGLFTAIAEPLNLPVNCQDKSRYNLFNPVPEECLRELSTDRPDLTESAYSVDPGHFQLEMSFLDYSHTAGQEEVDEYAFSLINFKLGLTKNTDLQLVFTPYLITSSKSHVTKSQTLKGFSDDTQLRLKINLWGNDTGDSALAVMPFIKFPWGSNEYTNDHFEGGLIVPLAVNLPNDWGLGLMLETDAIYDSDDDDYALDLVHTATIGHDIPAIKNLAGFIEYVGVAPFGSSDSAYQIILSSGLTYGLSESAVLDLGARTGVNGATSDLNLFMGLAYRY